MCWSHFPRGKSLSIIKWSSHRFLDIACTIIATYVLQSTQNGAPFHVSSVLALWFFLILVQNHIQVHPFSQELHTNIPTNNTIYKLLNIYMWRERERERVKLQCGNRPPVPLNHSTNSVNWIGREEISCKREKKSNSIPTINPVQML